MEETAERNPIWWHQRTTMERYLTIIAGATIFMFVVISIVLAGLAKSWKTDESSICLTPVCVHTASAVLKNMDFDVDPCENFYNFVCGSYVRETVIPDDKSSVDQFIHVTDHLQNQLRAIITEPEKKEDAKPYLLVKSLYAACMNESLIEQRGLEPIKRILKDMGGWPVLEGDTWNEGEFSWEKSVYNFRKYGYSVSYFIEFTVPIDIKNSTTTIILLDEPSHGSIGQYLLDGINDTIVSAYHQYQVEVAVIMGADRERAAKELKESLEFQIKLVDILTPSEKSSNITELYRYMTVKALQEMFPSIPWLEYINSILLSSVQVDNNHVIGIADLDFIEQLEILLSNTPKRVIANYAMTRAMLASVTYLTNDLRSKQLKYKTVQTGETERELRWRECISIVSEKIPFAVGSLYVQKYFDESATDNISEMVQDIRNEVYKILKNVDWMDEETRQHGLEKAYAMTVHIAYPDELLDKDKLEEFYKSLDVNKELYLESILNINKFGRDFSCGRLQQKVNKTDWIYHGNAVDVNALNIPSLNSIEIPAGILQGHFFHNERPKYMNYGAMGLVIGHEITHGFDKLGHKFDKDGNMFDWWAPSTKRKFLKKTRCIVEQYGNYTDKATGFQLDGSHTQNENIADNGGVKEAYQAYVAWTRRHGEEPHLPGLEFSPHQLFWISGAQSWCRKARLEVMKHHIMIDTHSPDEFRVLGPLSNSEEFAADFSCPKGSKMNPVNKCSVW